MDSTNIITPEVSLITNIGFDHIQFLGDTLPEIAFEKAGIIKQHVPVVIGEYQKEVFQVFEEIAAEKEAPLFLASKNISDNYKTDLKGSYQLNNVKTVVQAVYVLIEKGFQISKENIKEGLLHVVKNTGLLGRWQLLNEKPKVICDTGHNKEGLHYIIKQLEEETFEKLHIILGVVNDKDLTTILPLFPKNAIYYFCKPNIPRGLDAHKLQIRCAEFGLNGNVYASVKKAYKSALKTSSNSDFIFIGGSTFVVAEVV